MKKIFSISLVMALLLVWTENSFAVLQGVGVDRPAGGTDNVDGVNFTGAFTLSVGDAYSIGNTGGVSAGTTVDGQGFMTFLGSSTVAGSVGTAGLSLNAITAGVAGSTVTFSGDVFADGNPGLILNGTGAIALNGNYTGITRYNTGATGTITVADSRTMTGAINNQTGGQGTLTLGTASQVVGTVGNVGAGLAQVNMTGVGSRITGATKATTINLTGGGNTLLLPTITGQVDATTINMSAASGTFITGQTSMTTLNMTGGNATITGATIGNVGAAFNLNGNTLTVDGALTIPATGTLALTAASGTSFGKITATGAGTVTSGATGAVTVTGFIPNGSQLKIVDATGSVSVAGNLVVTSNSPAVSFTSNNTAAAEDWTLTATRVAGSPAATGVNSVTAATGDFAVVLSAVDALPNLAAVNAAYEQLDPTANGATTQVVFNTVNEAMGALTTHLGEAGNNPYPGGSGVSTGDFWKDNGIWVKGFGDSAAQDTHKGVNGYDSTMWGVIGGMDGVISHDVLLGLAGGYATTDINNKGESGGTNIDSYIGTIYVSYDDPSPWYGDMGFTFTWNAYDSSRRIVYTGVDRTATSNPDGQTYTGFWDLGYVVPLDVQWNITPIAGVTYSHTSIDKYTETGADSLNLTVNSQDYDQLLSNLGVRIDATVKDASGKWVPEAHFRWLYDFIGDPVATTSTFTGGGAAFDTKGLDPEQSTYNLGAGLTFYSKGNVSITGTYDYKFATDYSSHTGLGTVRYTF